MKRCTDLRQGFLQTSSCRTNDFSEGTEGLTQKVLRERKVGKKRFNYMTGQRDAMGTETHCRESATLHTAWFHAGMMGPAVIFLNYENVITVHAVMPNMNRPKEDTLRCKTLRPQSGHRFWKL